MPLEEAVQSTPSAASDLTSGSDFMSFDTGQDERGASQEPQTDSQQEPTESNSAKETPADVLNEAGFEQDPAGDPAADNPSVSFKGIKPEVVAIIKSIAKNSELELSNPRDFKLARQLAEKEATIRELKKSQEPSEQAKSYLDLFRDKDPEPATAEKTAAPSQASPATGSADLPPFVQLAKAWADPKDFAKSLLEAYQGDESPEMYEKIANTYMGFIDRTMEEGYLPRVMARVEKLLESRLGPVVQEVQQSQTQNQYREVVETLAKADGMGDIMDIFEPASDGTVMVEGQEAPDTWLNRALAEFPEILRIKETGKNDRETFRLTAAAQYRAAHRMVKAMRRQNLDPKSAGHLVKTGVAIAESKRDPVRHGLNQGRTGSPTAGDRRVDEIFGPQGGKSLDSIFG